MDEIYCDTIVAQVNRAPDLKDKIIRIKEELINRKMYSFEQFISMDVYNAVLNQNISNIEDLIAYYKK